VTHNERRFQFRLFNHLFRVVSGFMGKSRINRGNRRQNLKPKFAQVPEQSDFTFGVYLVVAEHLKPPATLRCVLHICMFDINRVPGGTSSPDLLIHLFIYLCINQSPRRVHSMRLRGLFP